MSKEVPLVSLEPERKSGETKQTAQSQTTHQPTQLTPHSQPHSQLHSQLHSHEDTGTGIFCHRPGTVYWYWSTKPRKILVLVHFLPPPHNSILVSIHIATKINTCTGSASVTSPEQYTGTGLHSFEVLVLANIFPPPPNSILALVHTASKILVHGQLSPPPRNSILVLVDSLENTGTCPTFGTAP